jgi:ribosomal protein S6
MPAAEVTDVAEQDERNSYEVAFHVLPTVAEGEVASVFEEIKAHIRKEGEIIDEEMPERIDLVYPIVKSLEGKNRKFTSAYFGWVRFKLESDKIAELNEELGSMQNILRHLLIKLTALEEARPYRFHEHRKSVKMSTTVYEDAEVVDDVVVDTEDIEEVDEVVEVPVEVDAPEVK